MKPSKVSSGIYLSLLLLSFAVLSCTIPIAFIRLPPLPFNLQFSKMAGLNPTIVDENNQVVMKPDWYCSDVDGLATYMQETYQDQDTINLKKVEVSVTFHNLNKDNNPRIIDIAYYDEIEEDVAVLDGVTGSIIRWYTLRTTTQGGLFSMVDSNGGFSGNFEAKEQRHNTDTNTTSTVTEVHNFFGLFNPKNNLSAQFCDLAAIPLPEGLDQLTPENFRDYCSLYYYECQPSKP